GLTREVQNFAFDAALEELRAIAARLGTAAEGGDGAAMGDALRRLATMLADGNGAALDCALAAQELLERALGAQEAEALLREVGNFDFDAALIRVRSLAAAKFTSDGQLLYPSPPAGRGRGKGEGGRSGSLRRCPPHPPRRCRAGAPPSPP
ncbi:MAG: hypothetical protein JO358_07890, partial [Alphaproteobacteria bacterium]|nr:hypothetical protein [Alphaproteobacteria bacterium]